MSQLIFKFPFKTTYFQDDFYVSSNNFEAYKLIESWPNWPNRFINIYGPKGCGKTHLSKILNNKIQSYLVNSDKIKEREVNFDEFECLIIDNYNNNIDQNFFYTILNHINQSNKYIIVFSIVPINKILVDLKDLQSRLNSFISFGIDLPTDDLLRVMITKSFSDKQIIINSKNLEYILKNIDRSYEDVLQFIKNIDIESLSSGKSININLIKKVLKLKK